MTGWRKSTTMVPLSWISELYVLTDFKRKMDAEEAIAGEKTRLCGNRFNMVEMEINAFPEMLEKCVEANSNEWCAHIEFLYQHGYDRVKKCEGLVKCAGMVYDDDYDTGVESCDESSDTLKLSDEDGSENLDSGIEE